MLELQTKAFITTAQSTITMKGSPNPKPIAKIDQGREATSGSLDRLVKPVYKFAQSLTETSSNVYKPLSYNEVTNNPVHKIR